MRLETGVIPPVLAVIELNGAELVEGQLRTSLGHLKGSYEAAAPESSSANARWVIQKTSPDATVSISFISQKGGTVRTGTINLNN